MSKKSSSFEFWNGQVLELQTPEKEVYYTQIMKTEPDLLVQRPVNKKGIPMPITENSPITVYFHDDQSGLYTFDSTIEIMKNNQTKIEEPSKETIKKAQRRRFFRVNVNIETDLILPKEEGHHEEQIITIHTHDISGGGISFLYPEKIYEEGDMIKGAIHLMTSHEQPKIEFEGKVVNVMKHPSNHMKTAVEFINMNEATRSEIIKFCINKQIELRKRS